MDMELNSEQARRHADVLLQANEAWFYGYHWTETDQEKLINALAFFEYVKGEQVKKLS